MDKFWNGVILVKIIDLCSKVKNVWTTEMIVMNMENQCVNLGMKNGQNKTVQNTVDIADQVRCSFLGFVLKFKICKKYFSDIHAICMFGPKYLFLFVTGISYGLHIPKRNSTINKLWLYK